ncbi:MAG: hypothetical protein V3U24_00450 [Candidatus Neomarinimicrobiota bacterium]
MIQLRSNTLILGTILILSGLLTPGTGIAEGDSKWVGDELVWEGIDAFYNYEFDRAVTVLTTGRKEFPAHPTVHLTWAVSLWLKAQMYDGIEESQEVLMRSLDEVIPVYENLLRRSPGDPHYRLYLFSARGLRTRVHLGRKEWFSVIIQGIKGYRGVASVHRENPELWDAYFPIGMLNYYAGISSPIVRFLAGLMGVNSGKEEGFEQIRTAAAKGKYSWIEANLTLIFIHLWVDDDYESALPLAEKMRVVSPQSIYNQHLYSESLMRVGKLEEAGRNLNFTFRLAEDLPDVGKRGWLPTLKYQRALLEFYRERYDSSMAWVTASIEEFQTELDTPLGFGYVLRGNIHDLKGERKRAVEDYRSALALGNYTSAMKHARTYLETPFQLPPSGR